MNSWCYETSTISLRYPICHYSHTPSIRWKHLKITKKKKIIILLNRLTSNAQHCQQPPNASSRKRETTQRCGLCSNAARVPRSAPGAGSARSAGSSRIGRSCRTPPDSPCNHLPLLHAPPPHFFCPLGSDLPHGDSGHHRHTHLRSF